jgi:hypothetical protein
MNRQELIEFIFKKGRFGTKLSLIFILTLLIGFSVLLYFLAHGTTDFFEDSNNRIIVVVCYGSIMALFFLVFEQINNRKKIRKALEKEPNVPLHGRRFSKGYAVEFRFSDKPLFQSMIKGYHEIEKFLDHTDKPVASND